MNEKTAKTWIARRDACRKKRKTLSETWKINVAYRKGKPFGSESELDRVAVPIDWSLTKAKLASLFSQVPAVVLEPKHPRYASAVPVFAKELNDVLQREIKLEVPLEESLCDAINAAGIGAVKCGYSATFEDVEVPAIDMAALPPEQALALMQSGLVPMTKVKRPVSEKFYARRISPINLLWPIDFTGSDFADADWIGHDGTMSWAEAKREFADLTDDLKDKVCRAESLKSLRDETSTSDRSEDNDRVVFSEIFYKSCVFDPEEKYFTKIRRIVFLDGLDEKPIVDEDLTWQQFDEQTGRYIGVCTFPIRIITLTYISDEPVPPSDSEIGRPQVDETMRSRSQMLLQRDRSLPLRWMDVNRIDPAIADSLMRGDYQGFIPTNGDGARAIGEVARAQYPADNWGFDRVTKSDLQDAWQVGPNQSGGFASGERSASEASIIQANFQTRVAFERAKVAKYITGIAEVIAGLMQLFYDKPNELPLVGEDGAQRIDQVWDRTKVAGAEFVFTIRPDSTVLLDASQRVDRLMKFLNLVGKSGYVNVEPIVAEIAALSGMDPAEVMTKPQPASPEQPNLSLRLSGSEDLSNPIVIAMLLKSGQAPNPDEIKAAKLLLQDALTPVQPPTPAEGAPAPQPSRDYSGVSEDWGPMPRVTKRVEELGG